MPAPPPDPPVAVDGWIPEPAPPAADELVSAPSYGWVYRERAAPTGNWSLETQGQVEQLDGMGTMFGLNLRTDITVGESYHARNAPLATATRRFRQSCVPPAGFVNTDGYDLDANGEYGRGYLDAPLTDSFWNPLSRLGILWGKIQLPPFRVIAPPEVNTYGGLVVNMPTWLQIDAEAWRPYFTDVDQYMGWQSQLGLFPAELAFEVVGAGSATIHCAPANSEASNGAIPGWPDDLTRYYELGQLGEDCTWVPQEPGRVTMRAKITYRVLLTISGYSEWLSPYVWYSDPLTMPVGELRIRNVTPEGGIGG